MTPDLDLDLLREVEQFVYREARLCDEHRYDEWEALWTDDALYWVPANGDGGDPTTQMSIIYDNRRRIATRIQQLHTGKRHSQAPPSRLRRIVSNVEVLDHHEPDVVSAGANFLIYEQSHRGATLWAGRAEYRLRRVDGAWRMAAKKVTLVDNDQPVYTLAFLV